MAITYSDAQAIQTQAHHQQTVMSTFLVTVTPKVTPQVITYPAANEEWLMLVSSGWVGVYLWLMMKTQLCPD